MIDDRLLMTSFVQGLIRLDDPVKLAEAGVSAPALGELVAYSFAELSLGHGLVHGDPHGGNVYARM